jgi:multiple sugar transport system permease protein
MRRRWAVPYLFLAPFMILFLLFYFASIVYAVYLSLFIQRGIRPKVFSGLANYVRVLHDSQFLGSLATIARFGAIQIPIMLVLALLLALYLDGLRNQRLRTYLSLGFFLPYAMPTVIAGLLWGYLYSKGLSPFNQLLAPFGASIDFLGRRGLLWSLGNIITWTWTGYNMVILYSALRGVPGELYEAARIDGASNLQVVRFIKLPMVAPALALATLFSIIGTLQIFAEPFVLAALTFVPTNLMPNLYIYYTAFNYGNFNYAAALAVVLALITFVLSLGMLALLNFQRRRL